MTPIRTNSPDPIIEFIQCILDPLWRDDRLGMDTTKLEMYHSSTKPVFIELNMDSIKKPNPRRRIVVVNSHASALDVIIAASGEDSAYKFKHRKGKFSEIFIKGINGIEEIPEENMFWILYVNGKQVDELVDSFVPDRNDVITMKFEKVCKEEKSEQ